MKKCEETENSWAGVILKHCVQFDRCLVHLEKCVYCALMIHRRAIVMLLEKYDTLLIFDLDTRSACNTYLELTCFILTPFSSQMRPKNLLHNISDESFSPLMVHNKLFAILWSTLLAITAL